MPSWAANVIKLTIGAVNKAINIIPAQAGISIANENVYNDIPDSVGVTKKEFIDNP